MTGEFWAMLTQQEREEFKSRSRPRRWRRGEVLFPEGGKSEWVAVVQTGRSVAAWQ